MSSGVFCSETAFDHPSYFDLSDSPLYSDEFDSTSKSLERQLAENNFNHLRLELKILVHNLKKSLTESRDIDFQRFVLISGTAPRTNLHPQIHFHPIL